MLRWVFPQVMVMWLCLLFFYEHKDMVQHYIVLLLPCVLFSILSFAGMLPIAIGYALMLLFQRKNVRKWIRQIFSQQNCVVFLTFGVVMILYYYGNVLAEKPAMIGFRLTKYDGKPGIYIVFVVFMVLVYCGCIFRENERNVCFYISMLSLITLPFFRMGKYNDLGMRCSIPALFIIFILVVQFLNGHLKRNERDPFKTIVLMIFILIGLISPLQELSDIIAADSLTRRGSVMTGSMESYANRALSQQQEDYVYNYYSYDIENNIFYRFIAQRK